VAIETTVGALRRELRPEFLIIRVTYGGSDTVTIPKDHSLFPYFFKRARWAWEQEVRVIGEMEPGQRLCTARGVPIKIGSLLRRIVVSPYARPSYPDEVERLLAQNAVSVPVTASVSSNNKECAAATK
jgi:hypothetical protein